MTDFDLTLLESLPDGVILTRGDAVHLLNGTARGLLPELSPGGALPEFLRLGGSGSGRLTLGETEYILTASRSGEEQLLLLHPAPPEQTGLTDGALWQLRSLTGELLAELGSRTDPDAPDFVGRDTVKSLHRLFRLVDNAGLLADAPLMFRPATLDLAGLCRRLTDEAGDLLKSVGAELHFECELPSLLMSGDGGLLRRMLLELISNAVKFGSGRTPVVLTLSRSASGAVLILRDGGGAEGSRRLADALRGAEAGALPRAGQGAGLGLAAARRVVSLHGGALLADCSADSSRLVISLPLGQIGPSAGVRTPDICADGGLDPVLTALSDLLPADIFGPDSLD